MNLRVYGLCALLFMSSVSGAAGGENSYDLYLKGQLRRSFLALNQELDENSRWSPAQLASRWRRARAIYQDSLVASGAEYLKLLQKFQRQANHRYLELPVELLIRAQKKYGLLPMGPELVLRHLKQVRENHSDGGVFLSHPRRRAALQALQAVALRAWRSDPRGSNLVWLYVAGRVGHEFYNSGRKELYQYLSACERRSLQDRSCRYYGAAETLYRLGVDARWPAQAPKGSR